MDNPDGPRRSSRLGGTATAIKGEPQPGGKAQSKGAAQKNSTSIALESKATPKATPKNSKAKTSKSGIAKKTTKMDVDEVEDEEGLHQKEARIALNPLLEEAQVVLSAFEDRYKSSTWYMGLKTRFELLGKVPDNIKVRKDLLDRVELRDPFICPSLSELTEGSKTDHSLLLAKFNDLEKHRDAVVRHGLAPVAPSAYCLHKAYFSYQLDPRTAVRAGRPQPYPIPLELLHQAFRTYTAWAVQNPDPSEADLDDEKFIQLDRCVRTLQETMPQLFSTHDARQKAFLKALLEVFPETAHYEWCPNEPADLLNTPMNRTKHKIDLVYRHRKTHIPLIFVEVKLEMGEGGDPFWQNNRLYQTYIELCPNVRRTGAPVFFLHLSGNMTFIQLFHILTFPSRGSFGGRWGILRCEGPAPCFPTIGRLCEPSIRLHWKEFL
jgi:hypothetical protein